MMNRRRVLAAMGTAALGGVAAELSNAADQHLSADLARIGSRVYSEEGVPMFLACENLAAIGTSEKTAPLPPVLNQRVASAFHRYAGEWQQIRPDARPGDVAKIMELVADRDFASGGTEVSL